MAKPAEGQLAQFSLPPIGSLWAEQDGIFAGILLDPHDQQQYALIVAVDDIGKHELGTYDKHVTAATSYWNGRANTIALADAGSEIAKKVLHTSLHARNDWYIPSQAEAHLLAANLKDQHKSEWYWTSTQYSRYDAWAQGFVDGGQHGHDKDDVFLVRPVRRLVLQPFSPSQRIEPDARAEVAADVCTVTYEEVLAMYTQWESNYRLKPSIYRGRLQSLEVDCEVVARESTDAFFQFIRERAAAQ